MFAIVGIFAVLIALFASLFWLSRHLQGQQRAQRARFIAAYRFPAALVRKYSEAHPSLGPLEVRKVFEGLRQYFLACLAAQKTSIAPSVGMPSRAVDDAWHDFILATRDYQAFCRQAFGQYLHHTPETMMGTSMRDALANTLHQFQRPLPGAAWATVGAVPLLFAMDRELGYADGFHHDADSLGELEGARERLAGERALMHKADGSGGSGCAGGTSSGGCCSGGSAGGCCSGGGCGGGGGCGSG